MEATPGLSCGQVRENWSARRHCALGRSVACACGGRAGRTRAAQRGSVATMTELSVAGSLESARVCSSTVSAVLASAVQSSPATTAGSDSAERSTGWPEMSASPASHAVEMAALEMS